MVSSSPHYPANIGQLDLNTQPIYIVSGGMGTSGGQLARTALAQFEEADNEVVVVSEVRDEAQLEEVISQAVASGGTIVHTLVDADLRERLGDLARENNVAALDLIENVVPIQLAIRLLLPAGSLLLDHPEVKSLVGPFETRSLVYPWRHPNPHVDHLQKEIEALVHHGSQQGWSRTDIFRQAWDLARRSPGASRPQEIELPLSRPAAPIPHLSEPWYC